jgi:hypothetical protein
MLTIDERNPVRENIKRQRAIRPVIIEIFLRQFLRLSTFLV